LFHEKAISRVWEIGRATYYSLLLVSKPNRGKPSKKNRGLFIHQCFLYKTHTVLLVSGAGQNSGDCNWYCSTYCEHASYLPSLIASVAPFPARSSSGQFQGCADVETHQVGAAGRSGGSAADQSFPVAVGSLDHERCHRPGLPIHEPELSGHHFFVRWPCRG